MTVTHSLLPALVSGREDNVGFTDCECLSGGKLDPSYDNELICEALMCFLRATFALRTSQKLRFVLY